MKQLCKTCLDIVGNAALVGSEEMVPHVGDEPALRENAARGCGICAFLHGKLDQRHVGRRIDARAQIDRSGMQFYWVTEGKDEYTQLAFEAAAEVGQYMGHDPVEPSTGSVGSERLARSWMRECTASHRACTIGGREGTWYPTRLLHVATDGDGTTKTARLVHTRSEPPRGPYMALSYCWGGPQKFMLCAETLDQLTKGIATADMPATFRDAVAVMAWFDVEYLWIDALCIQQDSRSDWEHEALTMKDVYKRALVTVAAAAATNVDAGCFRTRFPAGVEALSVEPGWNGAAGALYCVDRFLWVDGVQYSPLARRSWAVQERLLSPRILHFGRQQMYWECCRLTACETFPRGCDSSIVESHLAKAIFGIQDADEDGPRLWRSIVETYMQGSLTYPTDKVIAVAGIVEEMRHILADEYLAGLWRSRFDRDLLWYVQAATQAGGRPSTRPAPYRAPSWSWLSVDGEVQLETGRGRPRAQVVEVGVELADPQHASGSIRHGWARMRGVLLEVIRSWEEGGSGEGAEDEEGGGSVGAWRFAEDVGASVNMQTIYDEPAGAAWTSSATFVLPIVTDSTPFTEWEVASKRPLHRTSGLLLTATGGGGGGDEYRRTGLCRVFEQGTASRLTMRRRRRRRGAGEMVDNDDDDDEGGWEEVDRQTITIV